MHGDTIRGPHVDARAHTTRANSTPQRFGARAEPQRDGMAESKFEVRSIVGERLYRFRHEDPFVASVYDFLLHVSRAPFIAA
eukprot:SAG31_NODE_26_length_32985_cov_39.054096_19_plen_82_part_00